MPATLRYTNLYRYPVAGLDQLSDEEKSFLDHECDHLCSIIDDYSVVQVRRGRPSPPL